jgi:membrane protease subunit HflC
MTPNLATRPPRGGGLRRLLRYIVAALGIMAAFAASSMVKVAPGQAVVVTRFGDPVRVLTEPGIAWKIPAPIETTIVVDLRLRTTSAGLQDVGTQDGLRILVQAYAAWAVPNNPAEIRRFLRAAGNDPDEAARQLRSFMGSALQITASGFKLADLVNTDPARIRLPNFVQRLQLRVAAQALDIYGIKIEQMGVERLSLPAETLAATVARMRAERETIAAQQTAEGLRAAAQIRSDAARDARIKTADSRAEAAAIEAKSREQAAAIYGKAYDQDPRLYTMLRSLDVIDAVVGSKTRLVLRTDTPPFRVLVDGPQDDTAEAACPLPPSPILGQTAIAPTSDRDQAATAPSPARGPAAVASAPASPAGPRP